MIWKILKLWWSTIYHRNKFSMTFNHKEILTRCGWQKKPSNNNSLSASCPLPVKGKKPFYFMLSMLPIEPRPNTAVI